MSKNGWTSQLCYGSCLGNKGHGLDQENIRCGSIMESFRVKHRIDFMKVYESLRSCQIAGRLTSFWFLGASTVETMALKQPAANWMEFTARFWATKIFMDAIVAEACIMNPWLLRTFLAIFCSRFRLEPISSGSQKPAWFQILRPSGMISNWSQDSRGLLGYEREVTTHWSPQTNSFFIESVHFSAGDSR